LLIASTIFAYATDLSQIPPATIEGLRGLKVLVLDCLRIKPHETHLWLERALEYVAELKPERAYFTHITHDIKHERDSKLLPKELSGHTMGWSLVIDSFTH
jgi:phosphoribosyl 1,2-cyclic phosphate phosphodiesterase